MAGWLTATLILGALLGATVRPLFTDAAGWQTAAEGAALGVIGTALGVFCLTAALCVVVMAPRLTDL